MSGLKRDKTVTSPFNRTCRLQLCSPFFINEVGSSLLLFVVFFNVRRFPVLDCWTSTLKGDRLTESVKYRKCQILYFVNQNFRVSWIKCNITFTGYKRSRYDMTHSTFLNQDFRYYRLTCLSFSHSLPVWIRGPSSDLVGRTTCLVVALPSSLPSVIKDTLVSVYFSKIVTTGTYERVYINIKLSIKIYISILIQTYFRIYTGITLIKNINICYTYICIHVYMYMFSWKSLNKLWPILSEKCLGSQYRREDVMSL